MVTDHYKLTWLFETSGKTLLLVVHTSEVFDLQSQLLLASPSLAAVSFTFVSCCNLCPTCLCAIGLRSFSTAARSTYLAVCSSAVFTRVCGGAFWPWIIFFSALISPVLVHVKCSISRGTTGSDRQRVPFWAASCALASASFSRLCAWCSFATSCDCAGVLTFWLLCSAMSKSSIYSLCSSSLKRRRPTPRLLCRQFRKPVIKQQKPIIKIKANILPQFYFSVNPIIIPGKSLCLAELKSSLHRTMHLP